MDSKIAFGVGCFHFGLKAGTNTTMGEYFNELQKMLESISNISEIDIEFYEEDYDLSEDVFISPNNRGISNGGTLEPYIEDLKISFDIFIPKRIQEDLGHSHSFFKTERFRVLINYTYYFPVSIIQLLEPLNNDVLPSSAVILVREFLRKEFSKVKSFIDFQVLGPSPFHADFFIEKGEQIQRPFSISIAQAKGYDQVVISYNDHINAAEALEEILFETLSEFGFFYQLNHSNSVTHRKWMVIESNLDTLVEIKKNRKHFKNFFETNKIINELFINISYFEKDQIIYKSYIQKSKRSITHFIFYIDREIDERINYPTKQVTEFIKLYENQKLNVYVMSATVIAAVSGGLIGALITTFFN
ncbi:hypothetical protein QVE09_28300 [Paenibacillus sp. ClWae2A]|uniref:hypothetical protein n=1 Tax=Paenibacillus sp. ClWae2A TaxID=3057177 RepID=UPI0028F62455|nr:hypothetical protein [Paenibacillus sp. ClWae2A]MDT9722801.1 hypothetical protein [Paenibacillus sp. ClWae2A]